MSDPVIVMSPLCREIVHINAILTSEWRTRINAGTALLDTLATLASSHNKQNASAVSEYMSPSCIALTR
jgi:hypothetical protein